MTVLSTRRQPLNAASGLGDQRLDNQLPTILFWCSAKLVQMEETGSQENRSPLRRIVAILTFDSEKAGPAFGVRSVFTTSRQMLYSAEGTDLDLRVTIQNEECILAGQIINGGCAEGHIEISGVAGRTEATLNDVCEFTLPPVPAGKYSLTVTMRDLEIEIPELELKV
jgi:hypothetical protein